MSLPLGRLDDLPRLPTILPVAPARTGLEWERHALPSEHPYETAESRRVRTPRVGPTISPALVALEAEHSLLLRTLRPMRIPHGDTHRDIFESRPERIDPRTEALMALGEKIVFRELRRWFRQDLKRRFEDDPSLDFEDYQERRALIGQLGRGGSAEDLVIAERANELRNEYLNDSREDPERDVPLIQWGPLVLDDRGGLNVDVLNLRDSHKLDRFDLELAPSEEELYGRGYGESILFPNERYRIKSKMKLKPDLREVGHDWGEAFGKLAAEVQIDWKAPVLTDRSFRTELGGSVDAEGRVGLYLNLVIYGN